MFSCSLHFSGQKVLWLAGVTRWSCNSWDREVGRSLRGSRLVIKEVKKKKKKSNCPGVFFKHEFETWDVIMAFRSLLNRDWLRMFPRPIPQVCVEILHFSINISELVWLHWFFKRALYLVIYPYECVFVNNDKNGWPYSGLFIQRNTVWEWQGVNAHHGWPHWWI